jgi:glycolate oxidase subunit GlcD
MNSTETDKSAIDAAFLPELRSIVGPERCLTEPGQLLVYECDAITHIKQRPLAVVLPESTEEVQAVVRACQRHRVNVTPRGAGTGLSGGATPAPGGILVEMSRMRKILEVDRQNRFARVQPGVVNIKLSQEVADLGHCFAPDPSSQTVCTLGGNVAENAGGPHCLKYGCTSPHILAMTVVLPDGEILTLGDARGGPEAGLDLRGLFIGSEGTLGIVTEITCKLIPLPQMVRTFLASFATLEEACRAVSDIVAAGMVPAALEVLDERTIFAVENSVFRAGYPENAGAALLVEVDGHPAEVDHYETEIREILEDHAALHIEGARDPEHQKRLWKGRKGAFGAMGRLAPDLLVQDAVVPRSKLPEVIRKICAVCDELGLKLANVFHAGDGNLHPNICYDGRDPQEVEKVTRACRRIVEICLAAGGTLSGEHGIGIEKRDYMGLVFSDDDLETMKRVRGVWNPEDRFNPGKLIPTPRACAEVRSPTHSAGSTP